ncbi:MAG: ribosome silencing factor [Bacteroidales bacterium]|nr:ribosome silencing factor [Bacteroidales bacterium]
MAKKKKNESVDLANAVIEGMQKKKGLDIIRLDFEKIPNAMCKFFVICHATSKTQVDSIANSVDEVVKATTGLNPWHKEGYENAEWILLDYVDVVVHIFMDQTRLFFNLEDLWADAKKQIIENE